MVAPQGRGDDARVGYLDGLRGLACMQVVLCHYAGAFYPSAQYNFFSNGQSAVALFFLMSGYVLTPSFARAPEQLGRNAARRLVRLAVPAFAACWIAAFVTGLAAGWAQQAGGSVAGSCIGGYLAQRQPADLWWDIGGRSLLIGYRETSLFYLPGIPSQGMSVDRPLWTLSVEIFGSLLILLLVWCRHRSRAIHAAFVTIGFFVFGINELSLFLTGYLAARTWQVRWAAPWASQVLGAVLFGFGVFVCNGGAFGDVILPLLVHGVPQFPLYAFSVQAEIGGVALFFGLLLLPLLQRWLECAPLRLLGRLSFSIYLLHWPAMVSIGSLVFLALRPWGGGHAAVGALLAGGSVTFAAAFLFERYVDAPAIRWNRRWRTALAPTG